MDCLLCRPWPARRGLCVHWAVWCVMMRLPMKWWLLEACCQLLLFSPVMMLLLCEGDSCSFSTYQQCASSPQLLSASPACFSMTCFAGILSLLFYRFSSACVILLTCYTRISLSCHQMCMCTCASLRLNNSKWHHLSFVQCFCCASDDDVHGLAGA